LVGEAQCPNPTVRVPFCFFFAFGGQCPARAVNPLSARQRLPSPVCPFPLMLSVYPRTPPIPVLRLPACVDQAFSALSSRGLPLYDCPAYRLGDSAFRSFDPFQGQENCWMQTRAPEKSRPWYSFLAVSIHHFFFLLCGGSCARASLWIVSKNKAPLVCLRVATSRRAN